MKKLKTKKQQGFTLIELVIVVIILGILAAVAFVQFGSTTERAKVAEVLSVIGSYIESQIRFATAAADNKTTATSANLDVSLPSTTTLKYFGSPTLPTTPVNALDGTTDLIVSFTRSSTGLPTGWGSYTINGCDNGRTYCTAAGLATTTDECAVLGLGTGVTACP